MDRRTFVRIFRGEFYQQKDLKKTLSRFGKSRMDDFFCCVEGGHHPELTEEDARHLAITCRMAFNLGNQSGYELGYKAGIDEGKERILRFIREKYNR